MKKSELKASIKEEIIEILSEATAEEVDNKDTVSVLVFFADLNSSAKEIKDQAE